MYAALHTAKAALISFAFFAANGWVSSELHANEANVKTPHLVETKLSIPSVDMTEDQVAILDIQSQIDCNKKDRVGGYHGRVLMGERILRFDLFEQPGKTEVLLGQIEKPLTVEFFANKNCSLASPIVEIIVEDVKTDDSSLGKDEIFRRLAIKHSPFIGARPDQLKNPLNDRPLILAYSVHPKGKTHTLRYNAYFSDEDSLTSKQAVEKHNAEWGRTLDIEWIYELQLDENSQPIEGTQKYQGYLHFTRSFFGKYNNKNQPVLFNYANNNIFSPSSAQGNTLLTGHHLVPREIISKPYAREEVLFKHPWLFHISDLEIQREGRLPNTVENYLFFEFEKSMGTVKVLLEINGQSFKSAGKLSNYGKSVWGEKSYTAVQVDKNTIEKLARNMIPKPLLTIMQTRTWFATSAVPRPQNLKVMRVYKDSFGKWKSENISRNF